MVMAPAFAALLVEHLCLGRHPGFHLFKIGFIDAHDDVNAEVLARDRQPVFRRDALRPFGRDLDRDAA